MILKKEERQTPETETPLCRTCRAPQLDARISGGRSRNAPRGSVGEGLKGAPRPGTGIMSWRHHGMRTGIGEACNFLESSMRVLSASGRARAGLVPGCRVALGDLSRPVGVQAVVPCAGSRAGVGTDLGDGRRRPASCHAKTPGRRSIASQVGLRVAATVLAHDKDTGIGSSPEPDLIADGYI
jgi:hypothetical protein